MACWLLEGGLQSFGRPLRIGSYAQGLGIDCRSKAKESQIQTQAGNHQEADGAAALTDIIKRRVGKLTRLDARPAPETRRAKPFDVTCRYFTRLQLLHH